MHEQVILARRAQAERYGSQDKPLYNAHLSSRQIRIWCPLCEEGAAIMKHSVNEMGLSARAHDKILRVARTIADMAACDHIQPGHLQEAINFRLLDRNIWK